MAAEDVLIQTELQLNSLQSRSPQNCSLGLETEILQSLWVLVLIFALALSVFVLVLKHWSRLFLRLINN